jgi:hypothetical protein
LQSPLRLIRFRRATRVNLTVSQAEAEALLRCCLDIQKQTMPSDYRRYLTESLLGASLAGDRKVRGSRTAPVGGYEVMKQNAAAVSELNRQKMKKVGERTFFRARSFEKCFCVGSQQDATSTGM